MMRIKQAWWHIEDRKKPSKGVLFRQVTDIHTDQKFITFRITNYFVKLKIKSRFKGNELVFLQSGDRIVINLGDLENDWPSACNSDDESKENIRHIRLEIEYIDIRPKLDEIYSLKIVPRLGYEATHDIDGITQPEFYISVPFGMKMKNKGKEAKLLLIREHNGIEDNRKMFFEDVHIHHLDGKNAYYFLINQKSYSLLKSTDPNDIKAIKMYYTATNQFKFWFIPIFPLILIVVGYLNFNFGKPDNAPIMNLSYIIIFISFLTFYITLLKEEYEIPWNNSVIITTLIAGCALITPQFIFPLIGKAYDIINFSIFLLISVIYLAYVVFYKYKIYKR